ncbi:hypothetical protein OPQ81_000324 [Rhizoctonia solani]|nr:hypothetical protein OPQ81_000324 [Rhizoctonia solani]
MLCDLPPEIISLILGFLDLVSLKNCSESSRVLREVCSDPLLNPWHHPVRRAIYESFLDHSTKSQRHPNRDIIEYPFDVPLSYHESQTLELLATLGAFSCVPRSVLVDILALSPPRFLLYHSARSKLPRDLWKQAFRRRFLPSWVPHWVHTLQRSSWKWQESFFRVLEQVNHRLTSNCTSLESWTNYVVILRSGTAATCTAYSRTFSASAIMNNLKRQANLMEYETQARVIVQLVDIRIVMLGILRKPPYYAVNTLARTLLHPPGVERPEVTVPSSSSQNATTSGKPQILQPPLPQGVFVSPIDSPTRSSGPPRGTTLTTSRTRSPSRERRASIALRPSRTLTRESTSSTRTGESSSNRSSGIMDRIRRWTSADSRDQQSLSRERSVSISSPIVSAPISSPVPSWATTPNSPSTSMPLSSTPNPVSPVAPGGLTNVLPRLQYPEPSDNYAQYPNYTPGEGDNRWRIQDGLEEGGLIWVGPIVVTAQLVPHNVRSSSAPITAEEVYSEGRHVSFRWDDLIAIAPWIKERYQTLSRPVSFPRASTSIDSKPWCQVRTVSDLNSKYPIDPSPLPGTAPEHSFHLILQTPYPPRTWPSKLQDASPLLRDISALLKQHGGIVNFAWAPSQPENETERTLLADSVWQESDKPECYKGILYSPNRDPYTMPAVSKSSLPELSSIIPRPLQSSGAFDAPNLRYSVAKTIDIYVCTHGARDCRCGDIGGEIAQALRAMNRPDLRVFDIGHVGGHKWAGNVIVFPSGDWYGNLRPDDVPQLVEHITGPDRIEPWWDHWRGRMGLTKDIQSALHNAAMHSEQSEKPDTFSLTPIRRGQSDRPIHTIKFVSWEGTEINVQASEGKNLMQVAKDADLEGVEGICGGNLECATCHMYISPSAPLPRMSDAEDDMLAYAIKRKEAESRLGCQIDVTRELAAWIAQGGRIGLPRF